MADEQPWSRFRVWAYGLVQRNPKSNRIIADVAGLTPSDHVLDLGCGPGAAVRTAATIVTEGRAVGVDRSPPMVELARRRSADFSNVRFEVGAAEDLPFPDGEFSVVWSVHSYHHWDDHDAGLAEIRRVLAPGGRVFIMERDARTHGLTDEGAAELVQRLEIAGFTEGRARKNGKEQVISGQCR